MDHVTSRWAREFGMPDPGETADTVLAAEPDSLRRLAVRGRSAATALRDGAETVRRAVSQLRVGWSAPQPVDRVEAAGRTADAAAGICDGNASAIDECAAALRREQEAVRRAYRDADATIAAEGIRSDWAPAFGVVDPARAAKQIAVVAALSAAVTGSAERARAAASRLCATMGPDPRPSGDADYGAPVTGDASARTDADNRARLAADLASTSPSRRAFAGKVQQALAHGAATAGGASVELLAYDPDRPPGQGGAAIAVGDVSRADSVAVLVPGILSSPSAMSRPLGSAAALKAATEAAAPGSTSATVLWMGYDVPLSWPDDVPSDGRDIIGDSAAAVDDAAASAGGADLAAFCKTLRHQMDATAGLTLVGHSYGSSVVSQAARQLTRGNGVDDIVLLGSPGAGDGLSDATGYTAVPADHVYALAMRDDPVPQWETDVVAGVLSALVHPTQVSLRGPFGQDPTAADFGAQVIAATGASAGPAAVADLVRDDPRNGPFPLAAALPSWTVDIGQHHMDNYLGGDALAAVGAVVAGRYADAPVRPHR